MKNFLLSAVITGLMIGSAHAEKIMLQCEGQFFSYASGGTTPPPIVDEYSPHNLNVTGNIEPLTTIVKVDDGDGTWKEIVEQGSIFGLMNVFNKASGNDVKITDISFWAMSDYKNGEHAREVRWI